MLSVDKWIGQLAYTLWDLKEGGERLKEYRNLRHQERAPDDQRRTHQVHRLKQLVRHAAATSPWYRRQFETAGFAPEALTSVADLQQLPITTKADIRNNIADFISSEYTVEALNKAKTGGSTGVSLRLYFDERCQQWRNAAQMYADSLAGWSPGTRVAAIWGNPPKATTLKEKMRAYLLERMIYLDTMDLNPTTMTAFENQWRQFRPKLVFGHAHSIYLFAKYLVEQGVRDLRPTGVVATSMMLLDSERRVIEEAFDARVTNRYGCEEVGLIAVECEQHNGMHINSPHIILECLTADNQPAAPGEPGKLVVTDLNNYGMPLIRYRVEDVGVLGAEHCVCGRAGPILRRLEGRVADFLKKPDGGQVAGVSLVERTLTKVPGVEQMQLVQETLNEILIHRVRGKEFSKQTDGDLIDEFRQVFDETVTLTIVEADKIPQEASGKYRFSICKV